jgi:hypothetical protein
VRRHERRQAPRGFRALALGRDRPSASRLVGGDDDVDEPLEEVAFRV